jgi:hypothetical protein
VFCLIDFLVIACGKPWAIFFEKKVKRKKFSNRDLYIIFVMCSTSLLEIPYWTIVKNILLLQLLCKHGIMNWFSATSKILIS